MKKHDEGYVLPLVLVVMIVMCLIATSLMSFSLQNLKSQQASIERMQDKYVAEGAVEIVTTLLIDSEFVNTNDIAAEAKSKTDCKIVECTISDDNEKCSVIATQGNVTVSCELSLKSENGKIEAVTYDCYSISNTGGGSDETE